MNNFALLSLIDTAFRVYIWMMIIRVILSWIPLPYNPTLSTIRDLLEQLTEPVLGWFRRILPPMMAGQVGIDFSPIVAIFVLQFAYSILRQILVQILF